MVLNIKRPDKEIIEKGQVTGENQWEISLMSSCSVI